MYDLDCGFPDCDYLCVFWICLPIYCDAMVLTFYLFFDTAIWIIVLDLSLWTFVSFSLKSANGSETLHFGAFITEFFIYNGSSRHFAAPSSHHPTRENAAAYQE